MDHSIVTSLNHLLVHHDGIEDPVTLYERVAELLFLGALIAAFVLAWGHRRHDVRRTVVAAGLSAAAGLLIAAVLARIIDRPRPFVAHPAQIHLFSAHAADSGFPSDHATAAFAIAVAILLRNRVDGAIVLVFAALLAAGRVAIGVHYPTDVLAGAALGTLVAIALWPPAIRAMLDRLADLAGRILDTVVRRGPQTA